MPFNDLFNPAYYAFSPYAVPIFLTALAVAGLGILVAIREQATAVSRLFASLTAAIAAWMFAFTGMYCATSEDVALFWARAAYIGVVFISPAIYHFTVSVVGLADTRRRHVQIAWALAVFFLACAWGSDQFVTGVQRYWWGFYPRYGWLSAPFLGFFFTVMLVSLRHYWQAYRRLEPGRRRDRIKGFMIAFLWAYLAVVDYLPKFGVAVYPVGYVPVLCWLLLVERAIWRYQFMDITPAVAAEEIIGTIADAVVVFDLDGVIRVANRAAGRLFGRAHLIGRTPADLSLELLSTAQIGHVATRGSLRDIEVTTPVSENGTRALELSASAIRDRSGECVAIVCIVRDVTARKQAERTLLDREEQLRHAQKMEAVGRLAGGIAHDFNNLLTVIIGHGSLLAEQLGRDSPLRLSAEEIGKAAARAASLTSQLLVFSRKEAPLPRVVEVTDIVLELETMLRRLIGEDIQLKTVTHAGDSRVRIDPGHLEQVVMNLVINARDAMPQGGCITIETRLTQLTGMETMWRMSVRPGRYVAMTVTDSGHGMDSATLERLFEPFYTTKEPGKGTGLGLSVVYGIIEHVRGNIRVTSTPMKGTRFEILLPQVDEPVSAPSSAGTSAIARGSETLLVVEDEPMVRNLVETTLTARGYEVLHAKDAESALALVAEYSRPIHVLITDVIMPLMNGPDLARHIHARAPAMKVLYISGYAAETQEALLHTPGSAFLPKPFTTGELARKVRMLLDS